MVYDSSMNRKIFSLGVAVLPAAMFLVTHTSHAADTDSTKTSASASALAEMRKQTELISAELSLQDAQLRKELSKYSVEKQRRETETSITYQRAMVEMSALQIESDKLQKQMDLMAKRISFKDAERRTRLESESAPIREKLERLRLANELATAEMSARTREISLRQQEIQLKQVENQLRRLDAETMLQRMNTEIELRDKRDKWKDRVYQEIKYTKDVFKNGVLTVSDRRIALNDVITMDTADYITERINYFNNQSREWPIFIVIDSSPGGSVAAGYKILKTMSGSHAPVYVVVKSFAASMAAGITTLAKKSFAYPNAIILHHQLLGGTYGNLTEHRERVKELEEWWRRLASPVAAKMGISLDEFIKRMYRARTSGDWREFADSAKSLKWVDETVDVIREESFTKNPDTNSAAVNPFRRFFFQSRDKEQLDPNGKVFVKLPRLAPIDAYYLYNPDNYYRYTQ